MTDEEKDAIIFAMQEAYSSEDGRVDGNATEFEWARVLEAVGFWDLVEAAEYCDNQAGEPLQRWERQLRDALARVKGG